MLLGLLLSWSAARIITSLNTLTITSYTKSQNIRLLWLPPLSATWQDRSKKSTTTVSNILVLSDQPSFIHRTPFHTNLSRHTKDLNFWETPFSIWLA